MRIPWLSFGAVALLATLAIAQLRSLHTPSDVGGATLAPRTVTRTDFRSGKHVVLPMDAPSLTPAAAPGPFVQPQGVTASTTLIIPVSGISRAQLVDTWGAARSQGRTHEGIDILAPQGTPVLAAASGRIEKFFDSERGGVTVYEFDTNERFVYYYAHLLARAPGLAEGYQVRQGQVIGYVGMTGNASIPHLHFEVERLGPEHHWWQAQSMNPYPLLMAGQSPSA